MDSTVRKPQQNRSRETLERILTTGVELLAERGYDDLSIADVSTRSGVSVGSIYARFASRADLFTALQERILLTIEAEQAALFTPSPPEIPAAEVIDRAVHIVADHFNRKQDLLRIMILRGATDATTRKRGSRSSLQLAVLFAAHLRACIAQFGHADPELAIDICFRVIYASLTRRIMSGAAFESPHPLTWTQLTDELARMCRLYLLAPPGEQECAVLLEAGPVQ